MATPIELSPRRKRQIALLYHFASLDYLKGLLPQTEELIRHADELASERAHLDPLLMSRRWGARDTSANWSTYVFPALVEFRESTLWHIQARAQEIYGITGANQCARMLAEYSTLWMLPEQEQLFNERFEQVYKYAKQIDYLASRPRTLNDYGFWKIWKEHRAMFPRLPQFRIRTDVEGETGKVPPRTGVYIPQDDEWGAPQFAWTGGQRREDGSRWYNGQLDEAVVPNAFGSESFKRVGLASIWPWDDAQGAMEFLKDAGIRDRDNKIIDEPERAVRVLSQASSVPGEYVPGVIGGVTTRPCRWHHVELIEGEYEDTDEPLVHSVPKRGPGMYAASDEFCPYPGVWECLEHPLGPQTFAHGVVMPRVEGKVVTWQLKKTV